MPTETLEPDPFNAIVDAPFDSALSERYLVYALSTITARSLPDVRDGLKPVHRRLLWAMRLLKLDPAQGYKKCARVVGDVIGKYHPHGDQSVYDALVRLAQRIRRCVSRSSTDRAISAISTAIAPRPMRYTEARMTRGRDALLLEGIDENAVDFRETYDGDGAGARVVLPGQCSPTSSPMDRRRHRRRYGDERSRRTMSPNSVRRGARC